jgi:hypothetical protein
VLSLHLKWLTVPQLLLNQESLFSFPHLKLYGPDPHPALPSPELYRGVEGEEAVIERKFGRDVETVVRGRTRTRVGTDMPGFEGEWMEARDVMEYLEERGVRFVGVEHSFPPPLAVDNEKHPSRNLGTVSELISSGSSISKGSPAVEATRPKFRGFLNLQVLIEYLGMRSYCIGPAPAMRKDDVDQALRLSIVRL